MDQFIQIYEKVFTPNYCKALIEQFNKAEELGFCSTRKEVENADKINKDDVALFYPAQIRTDSLDLELLKKLNQTLFECYSKYANTFGVLQTLPYHASYFSKVQKTKPGEGYHIWHCEHSNHENSSRVLAWTVYLNDTFEAGETEFLYQQYRYKPQQGDLVIFPAAFTHTHRGNPPIGGDKYIITGWIEF